MSACKPGRRGRYGYVLCGFLLARYGYLHAHPFSPVFRLPLAY